MPLDDEGLEGTGGEQGGSSGAPGSQAGGQGDGNGGAPSGGATKFDPEFLKQLESVDPRELPDNVRVKLEKPFLSEFTKQNQRISAREAELDRQQSRIFDLATAHLQNRGVQPTPNQMDALRERIKSGEFTLDALPDVLDDWYKTTVQPRVDGMTVNQIMADTQREYPVLMEPEVARQTNQLFSQHPELAEMSRAGGMRGTHWVLRGIAQDVELARTKAELTALKAKGTADIEAAKKTAVEEYRRKAMGLPSESSRAGSTVRGEGKGDTAPDLRQSMEEAWEETFGKGR